MQSLSEKALVLGIPVTTTDLAPEVLYKAYGNGQAVIVASVNPIACSLARSDAQYVLHLKGFDWVICDGIGMVVAARRALGAHITRTTFDRTSLAVPVFNWAAEKGIKVVLVGAPPGTAAKAGARMAALTPGLQVEAAFSGYGEDPKAAKDFLLDNPGRLVVCGMGSPRQEAFLYSLKSSGWKGIGFTCGGFLDQLAEKDDYFPRWVDRLHIRFLYRLFKEPRRMGKRYFVDYQVFLWRFATMGFASKGGAVTHENNAKKEAG